MKHILTCCFLFIIAISLVPISCTSKDTLPKQVDINASTKGGVESAAKDKYDTGVMIYAIALGFIGLFNMYNALEIYKKKELIDKELAEILHKHRDIEFAIKEHQLGLTNDYKKMALEVKEASLGIEAKVTNLNTELDLSIKQGMNDIENRYSGLFNRLETHYNDVVSLVTEARNQFDGFRSTMEQDFNKHLYSYKLYTLIPHYLMDEKNRTDVKSACLWFSQWGSDDDLKMLKERRSIIPPGDVELITICEHAILGLEEVLRIS